MRTWVSIFLLLGLADAAGAQSTWRILPTRNPITPPRRIVEEEEEEPEPPPRHPIFSRPTPPSERSSDAVPPEETYVPYRSRFSEPGLRLVNSKKIRLNYQVKNVGPSGVEAVEIWGTRDGTSWKCYSKDASAKPPFIVEVPEEGRYGFALLVKSGVGLARRPPEAGDKPQIWVEVDVTNPTVRIQDVTVGKGNDLGLVTIDYKASDRGFGRQPIRISYAKAPDGPWTPVASNLENTGRFIWRPTAGVPYRVYVRVEAMDRAGNIAADVSSKPALLDTNQPEGLILGVDPHR